MEILQTIWSALSSENNIAMTVISIPMTFIEVILIFLLFTIILNISYTKKQAFLYISIFSIISLVSIYLIPTPYNTFINVMIYPVLVYFILRTNALKSILAEIVVYFLFFIIVTPLVAVFTRLLNITSMQVSSIPLYKLLYSTFLYIIMFLVYKIIKKLNFHIKFLDKFDLYNYNFLIINFIIGTVSIALQGYIEFIYIDYLPITLVWISIIILLFYFFISLFSLFRTSQLEYTKSQLATEKTYNSNLKTLHDNIRGFKHDFNNMVQAIRWVSFN